MRILLSNDDGIDAPGLKSLEKIARELTDDVWIVAPAVEQSAASHSLTIRTPLRIRKREEKIFAIEGTPTDCVLLALEQIMKGGLPDLVLSGVNNGDNLSEDVTYSGTVAAAMEASLLGIKSIALSQETFDNRPPDWDTAEKFGAEVIRRCLRCEWPPFTLFNINFPGCAPGEVSGIFPAAQAVGAAPTVLMERLDPRERPYYWIGAKQADNRAVSQPDSDLAAVARKGIAVTPMHLDLTHMAMLAKMKESFA